jgi:hypothetical protein
MGIWTGRASRWFRGTQDRHDAIDAAYRTKYERYPAAYVDPTGTPEARGATIRLVPR